MVPTKKKDIDRFWSHVVEDGDCWVWRGAKVERPQFSFNGINVRSYRISYELTYGKIGHGMCVCHRCDNSKCVRPSHLFEGTLNDNASDMTQKGRRVVGERHGMSKLSSDEVREIRKKYVYRKYGDRKIAKEFGVTSKVIWLIRHGFTWRHVSP